MTKVSNRGKKARSFSGCKCCKQAKRKCPEERPNCSICEKLGLKCEYDLNFLFRCEMVDFDGHVSKAARITRPAPLKTEHRHSTPLRDGPPSPQKYIVYEFIDESASIMSPTLTQERSPTPNPKDSEFHNAAINLLLEAAHVDTSTDPLSFIPTPPQSPDGSAFNKTDEIPKQTSRGSLEFILN